MIVCRAMQSLFEALPSHGSRSISNIHTLIWLQAQHLEAFVQLPPPMQQIKQRGRPVKSTGTFVAMANCLFMLQEGWVRNAWRPGRRDHRLLANVMLRGLRHVAASSGGDSPWLALMPMLTNLFRLCEVSPGVEETVGAVAVALLRAGKHMLDGPHPAGTADAIAARGMGLAVLEINFVACTLLTALERLLAMR